MLPRLGMNKRRKHKAVFKFHEISGSMTDICPGATEFRVISSLSATDFLVLAQSHIKQFIVLCTEDQRDRKLLATLPIHRRVLCAKVNHTVDRLLLTLDDSPVGLSFGTCFSTFCMVLNGTNVMYPVTSSSECVPRVDWFENSSKLLVSGNGDRYETWEFRCSQVEFQIKQEGRSKQGIRWWNVDYLSKLEYIQEKNATLSLVSTRTLTLPFSIKRLLTCRHLSSRNQDCLLCLTKKGLVIVLPRSSLHLSIPFELEAHRKYFDDVLYRFCALERDLVFVLTPDRVLHVILLDGQSHPRAYFELHLEVDCVEESVCLSSLSRFTGIDVRNGKQLEIDFEYQTITESEPRLFLPLLHFSVLTFGRMANVFNCLTYEILTTFWNGLFLDEYALMLARRDMQSLMKPEQIEYLSSTVSTFCTWQHFEQELSRFVPYQTESSGNPTSKPIQNWKMLAAVCPELLYRNEGGEKKKTPLLNQILKVIAGFNLEQVSAPLRFFVCLQIIAFQWGLWQRVPMSQEMMSLVEATVSKKVCQFWEEKEVLPVGGSFLNKKSGVSDDRKIRKLENSFWKFKNEPDMRNFQVFACRDAMTVRQAIHMHAADKINKDVTVNLPEFYNVLLGKDLSGGRGSIAHQYSLL